MSCLHLYNPAGGIRYHLRALRWKNSLWQSFREQLNVGLEQWKAASPQLVIIGCSGGYTLTHEFLNRFDHITLVDPDPLASCIFKTRFPHFDYSEQNRDYLQNPQALSQLLQNYPHHSFLFSNILGQRRFLYKQQSLNTHRLWIAAFNQLMKNRSWCSYHDRLSSKHQPDSDIPFLSAPHSINNLSLTQHFYAKQVSTAQTLEFIDHETSELFYNSPRQYFSWPLTPDQFHLIELIKN